MTPIRTMRALGLALVATLLAACGTDATGRTASREATGAGQVAALEASVTSSGALQRLLRGNQRFVAMQLDHPDQTSDRRLEVSTGQHPFAIVLTCADSRVPPELVFDQGLGDLFVVRVAGNVLDDHVIGSIEYAAEHLEAPLVMVLGHERCGAVEAAVKGGEAPGKIASLLESLMPAVKIARSMPGDLLDNAVRVQAQRGASQLSTTGPILSHLVAEKHLAVVGARYDLDTGKVDLLPSSL